MWPWVIVGVSTCASTVALGPSHRARPARVHDHRLLRLPVLRRRQDHVREVVLRDLHDVVADLAPQRLRGPRAVARRFARLLGLRLLGAVLFDPLRALFFQGFALGAPETQSRLEASHRVAAFERVQPSHEPDVVHHGDDVRHVEGDVDATFPPVDSAAGERADDAADGGGVEEAVARDRLPVQLQRVPRGDHGRADDDQDVEDGAADDGADANLGTVALGLMSP